MEVKVDCAGLAVGTEEAPDGSPGAEDEGTEDDRDRVAVAYLGDIAGRSADAWAVADGEVVVRVVVGEAPSR